MTYRLQVLEQFRRIRAEGLHGVNNNLLPGFRRGVDVYGEIAKRKLVKACRLYSRAHGHAPNLIDPCTFTEKQVLFKFFGLVPDLTPSDKLRSASYLPVSHRHLIEVPRRIWVSEDPALPANDAIPAGSYFLKSNHGSGTNLPVRFPLDQADRDRLSPVAQNWLTRSHGQPKGVWWYDQMVRNIYLEEDLRMHNGDAPDWKFFVCNGRVVLFQVDVGRFSEHLQSIYDRQGNPIADELYHRSGPPVEMPSFLDDMVRAAEAIGRSFDFIRVDMFVHNNRPYLGEIGLVPNGAALRIRSERLDRLLSDAWTPPWFGWVDATYSTGHYARVSPVPWDSLSGAAA